MTSTFERMSVILSNKPWLVSENPQEKAFTMEREQLFVRVTVSEASMVVHSYCRSKCPLEHRSAVCRVLTAWNAQLTFGNWEMDCRDGEVRFKASLPFAQNTIDLGAAFDHLLFIVLREMKAKQTELVGVFASGRAE
jgi:hypothetical protein